MIKDGHFDSNTIWYDLWMQQSKQLFEATDQNMRKLFSENKTVNPEEHLEQINAWLEKLNQQWDMIRINEEQKFYNMYWKMINTLSKDSFDLMLSQWIKKTRDQQPITSMKDLYQLWHACCHEVYLKTLQSKSYQDVYSEFMDAAYKIWKQSIPS